jgi:hypothetical protein
MIVLAAFVVGDARRRLQIFLSGSLEAWRTILGLVRDVGAEGGNCKLACGFQTKHPERRPADRRDWHRTDSVSNHSNLRARNSLPQQAEFAS